MSVQTSKEIQQWLIAYLSRELEIKPENVFIDENFVNFGLTSRQAIALTGDLEEFLGRPVDPAIAWEYPTIRRLADCLGKSQTA